MNLINFFRYFEGNRRVTDLAAGIAGSLKIRLGAGGVSHILEIKIGDVQRSELWGYDPTDGCWKAIGYSKDGGTIFPGNEGIARSRIASKRRLVGRSA
jgi:hypothetical protein